MDADDCKEKYECLNLYNKCIANTRPRPTHRPRPTTSDPLKCWLERKKCLTAAGYNWFKRQECFRKFNQCKYN